MHIYLIYSFALLSEFAVCIITYTTYTVVKMFVGPQECLVIAQN